MAVGGDGTFHEVVNGMLKRKDKKKIPVGFLPNGSANDTNLSFGVNNLDQALDYLIKGESMKMDIVSCLIDYQKVEDIPQDKLLNHHRYSIICAGTGIVAKIVHRAIDFKRGMCSCCNPYIAAALVEFWKGESNFIGIEVDG